MILTTYKSWDDPPSKVLLQQSRKEFMCCIPVGVPRLVAIASFERPRYGFAATIGTRWAGPKPNRYKWNNMGPNINSQKIYKRVTRGFFHPYKWSKKQFLRISGRCPPFRIRNPWGPTHGGSQKKPPKRRLFKFGRLEFQAIGSIQWLFLVPVKGGR